MLLFKRVILPKTWLIEKDVKYTCHATDGIEHDSSTSWKETGHGRLWQQIGYWVAKEAIVMSGRPPMLE
jgi:hypothetical protein